MTKVSKFEEVRADGNVIPEGMTLEDMHARGWQPCKVIALRWTYDGKLIEFSAPHGI